MQYIGGITAHYYDRGEKIIIENIAQQCVPVEFHVKQDGAKDGNPSLLIILRDVDGVRSCAQISFAMLQPVLDIIEKAKRKASATPRPIDGVILAFMTVVPADYEKRDQLHDEVTRIIWAAAKTPPETMYERWNDLGCVLDRHFRGATEPWVETIGKICNAILDYREYVPK